MRDERQNQEISRHRRHLSLLTMEQQTTLEAVLISVADHMFEVVVEGVESCPDEDRYKYLRVWRSQAA
jgi:hypothetical protein